MEQLELEARKRRITGKKVKRLRQQGLVPAILYGHDIDPIPIQVEEQALNKVLRKAGRNRLISLYVGEDGNGEPHLSLVKEVQRDAITQHLLHADFQEVVMTETITAEVPIELTGESPVVESGESILFTGLDRLEIECLPDDLVDVIEINLTEFTEINQSVHVKDLHLGTSVEILSDPDELIVRTLPPSEAIEELEALEEEEAIMPEEVELVGRPPEEVELEAEEAPEVEEEALEEETGEEVESS